MNDRRPKPSTPPPPPPCSVCGMPWDLRGTRAHRAEHRRLDRLDRMKRPNKEKLARLWLAETNRVRSRAGVTPPPAPTSAATVQPAPRP